MGSFNVLVHMVECSNSHDVYEGRIQFKYGDKRQYEYKLGDKLKCGGNDSGSPDLKIVKAYGVLENDICPICNKLNELNEFDIYIEGGIITKVSKMADINDYLNEYQDFKVLE